MHAKTRTALEKAAHGLPQWAKIIAGGRVWAKKRGRCAAFVRGARRRVLGASGTVGQYLFTCQGVDSGWLTVVRMFLAGVVLLGGALRHRPQLRPSGRTGATRAAARALLRRRTDDLPIYLPRRHPYSNSATATVLQYMGQALILLWVPACAPPADAARGRCARARAPRRFFACDPWQLDRARALAAGALLGPGGGVADAYTLLPGDLLRRYPVSVCTGCGMFIGGVVLLVLTQAWRIPVALNAAVALGTLEISVVGTALAFTLYLQGVSDVGGVRASLLACTEPVSAALCAALWLHTSFAWQDLLGFAAILVMAVLITLPSASENRRRRRR